MEKANKIRRFLAIAAVLAALLVIATITFRMQQGKSPKANVRKLPVQVDISLQKFHYTETKQGVKRWDLSAERAQYDRSRDVTILYGVKMVLVGTRATGELQITADRADYQNSTQDVALAGNVRGQGAKGVTFSASKVRYLASSSRIETGERVRFVDGGLELEGVGMEFDTRTRRLKLMKDVTAVYRPQRRQ